MQSQFDVGGNLRVRPNISTDYVSRDKFPNLSVSPYLATGGIPAINASEQRKREARLRGREANHAGWQRNEKAAELWELRKNKRSLRGLKGGRGNSSQPGAMSNEIFDENGASVSQMTQEQKNADSHNIFAELIAKNPSASKKEVEAFAGEAMSKGGGVIDKKRTREMVRETRGNRNQKTLMRTAITGGALSFAGSVVGDSMGEGGQKAGNAISTVTSAATFGSTFGPWGTAIGVAVGATAAYSTYLKEALIPLGDMSKHLSELDIEAEKAKGNLSEYLGAKERGDALSKDPNASKEEIKASNRKQAVAIADMPEELRSKILSANAIGGDKGKSDMSDAISQFEQKTQGKLNSETALASVTSNADKNNTALGSFWRDLTRRKGDDGGKIQLDDEELNKSLVSFTQNYDFKALKEKADGGGPGNSLAKAALGFSKQGDFNGFLKANKGLGIVSDKIIDDALVTTTNVSLSQLTNAFKRATQNEEKVAKIQEEIANRAEKTKAAFEDFKKYEKSFGRKNALEGTVSSNSNSLMNARLGIVANQPGTSDSVKNALAYSQEMGDLGQQEEKSKRDLSASLLKIVGETYTDKGRGALNKAGGENFVSNFLKSGLDSGNADQMLASLLKVAENSEDISGESKIELETLNNEYKAQSLEIMTNRQIALEQLKAVQEISRKQKFDQLIESLQSKDPMQAAFDSLDFADLKNSVLKPDSKTVKKEQDIRTEAIRNRNSDPLVNLIGDRVTKAQNLIKLDEEKKKNGEQGLNVTDVAKTKRDIINGNFVMQNDFESKGNIAASKSLEAKRALKESNFEIASGGGIQASMQKGINVLLAAASNLDSPRFKEDRARLIDQADSIRGRMQPLTGQSGKYSEAQLKIDSEINKTRDSTSITGAAKEDAIKRLLETKRLLSFGDEKGALAVASPTNGRAYSDTQKIIEERLANRPKQKHAAAFQTPEYAKQVSEENKRNSQDEEIYQKALVKLKAGDGAGAAIDLASLNKRDSEVNTQLGLDQEGSRSQAEPFKEFLQGMKEIRDLITGGKSPDAAINDGLTKSSQDAAGITDTKPLNPTEGLVAQSNKLLTTATSNLGVDIRNLSAMMQKEAAVAGFSSKADTYAGIESSLNSELGALKAKYGDGQPTTEQLSSARTNSSNVGFKQSLDVLGNGQTTAVATPAGSVSYYSGGDTRLRSFGDRAKAIVETGQIDPYKRTNTKEDYDYIKGELEYAKTKAPEGSAQRKVLDKFEKENLNVYGRGAGLEKQAPSVEDGNRMQEIVDSLKVLADAISENASASKTEREKAVKLESKPTEVNVNGNHVVEVVTKNSGLTNADGVLIANLVKSILEAKEKNPNAVAAGFTPNLKG
jgi:hypothetical protein